MPKDKNIMDEKFNSIEKIAPYFQYPISKAAKELNVCSTNLKKNCRLLGIERWPYRKFKALKTYHDEGMPIEIYEQKLNQLSENPNLSLAMLIPKAKRRFEINASQSASSQERVAQISAPERTENGATADILLKLLDTKQSNSAVEATFCTPTYTPLATHPPQRDEIVCVSSIISPSQTIDINTGSTNTPSYKR